MRLAAYDPRMRYLAAYDPRVRYLSLGQWNDVGAPCPPGTLPNATGGCIAFGKPKPRTVYPPPYDLTIPPPPPVPTRQPPTTTIVLSPTSGPIPPPQAITAPLPWLDQDSLGLGFANKWLVVGGLGFLLLSSTGGRRR